MATEQRPQQQQQQHAVSVKSAPWQPLQYARNVNVGHRHYIGELS